MTTLNVLENNGVKVVESREVARMVDKRHDHLIRDIEGYIKVISNNPTLGTSNFFIESSYKQAGNGKENKCYLLTKQGCEMVANKMTGEKGVLFTATYVQAFNQMETALQQRPMDSYMIEDPVKRAERWIEERKEYEQEKQKRIEAEAIIEEQKPKIEYYDKVMSDKHLITTTCIAKAFGMSAKKLNHILSEQGLIYKQGNAWYLYSKWENNRLAKLVPVETKGGIRYQLLWTEKGKQGIYGLLKALNYIELATINTEYLFS